MKDFVQKKGTALGPRNNRITTATHIVQIAKFLTDKMKFKKSNHQLDSIKQKMAVAQSLCNKRLNEFFYQCTIIFKKILVSEKSNENVTKYRDRKW